MRLLRSLRQSSSRWVSRDRGIVATLQVGRTWPSSAEGGHSDHAPAAVSSVDDARTDSAGLGALKHLPETLNEAELKFRPVSVAHAHALLTVPAGCTCTVWPTAAADVERRSSYLERNQKRVASVSVESGSSSFSSRHTPGENAIDLTVIVGRPDHLGLWRVLPAPPIFPPDIGISCLSRTSCVPRRLESYLGLLRHEMCGSLVSSSAANSLHTTRCCLPPVRGRFPTRWLIEKAPDCECDHMVLSPLCP